jgi:hypothetical protein
VVVEEGPEGRPQSDRKFIQAAVLGHPGVVLTLLGLLAYATARATADGFYGALSVVPEEVGVTYTSVLSRAALYLALVALFVIVGAESVRKGRTRRSALRSAVGTCFVALFVFAVLLGQQLFLLRVTLLGLAVWLFVIGYTVYKWSRLADPVPTRLAYWETLSRLAVVGLLTFALMLLVGRDLARGARRAVPFGPNFFQLFSVRSDVVCLRATNGPVPRERVGPFVYLGEAQGTMVLFDYRSSDFNVIRLPSSEVMTEWATPNEDPGFFAAFKRTTWTCPRSRGFGTQVRTGSR